MLFSKRNPLRGIATFLLDAAILFAMTFPWLSRAGSTVAAHWDPPFHAWKLCYAARWILAGHILPPDGNTNMYYPHPGAFFYEALHWPQALVAAPLLAAGWNDTLAMHTVLVLFWLLSGWCFRLLLREAGLGRAAAWAGGVFWLFLPYRFSYLPEFNMQLSFGLPLVLLFLLRYERKPGLGPAVGMALAWWLQATSELYQAFFLLFILPFWLLPLFRSRPDVLRSWKIGWRPFVAAVAVGGILSWIWLGPYLPILSGGTLLRDEAEVVKHALEPLSWFRAEGMSPFFSGVRAHRDEMIVYPTLLVAACALFCRAWRGRDQDTSVLETTLRWIRTGSFLLFWGFVALVRLHVHPQGCLTAATICPFPGILAGVAILFLPRQSREERIFDAFATSALFAFFMAFGPRLTDLATGTTADNPLFLFFYDHIRALHGFRVVSRFSVFAEMFLCYAAALFLDRACHRLSLFRQRKVHWAWKLIPTGIMTLVLGFFLWEARVRIPYTARPIRDFSESPVLKAFDSIPDGGVLAILPMGNRYSDSEQMLSIAGSTRLSVYAWGGTYPPYTRAVQGAAMQLWEGRPEPFAELLRELWPEAYPLLDRKQLREPERERVADALARIADPVSEDEDLTLYRLRQDLSERTEFIKRIRPDFVNRAPNARFRLSSASGDARVWVDLNGRLLGVWEVGTNTMDCTVALPAESRTTNEPNRLRFHAERDVPFLIDSFALSNTRGAGVEPQPPTEKFCPSWTGLTREVPSDMESVSIDWPGGLRLDGYSMESLTEDGWLRVRMCIHPPASKTVRSSLLVCLGIALDGNVLWEEPFRLSDILDRNAAEIGFGERDFLIEREIQVPSEFRARNRYNGVSLTIRSETGKRLTGNTGEGARVRRLVLPIGEPTCNPIANTRE